MSASCLLRIIKHWEHHFFSSPIVYSSPLSSLPAPVNLLFSIFSLLFFYPLPFHTSYLLYCSLRSIFDLTHLTTLWYWAPSHVPSYLIWPIWLPCDITVRVTSNKWHETVEFTKCIPMNISPVLVSSLFLVSPRLFPFRPSERGHHVTFARLC